ncbi:DinB family protein [Mucilaginibacter sp. UR6-11]|uniref:DinB family protein n=1 Tax=Mucilaginibacter sp. UR6-11 TaxID=1435644 RepID=UPI001E47288B|nr:DinB family protein [Mucilaginibacter sp. UR6-11]MCC8425251.1 DinB family protein [Mucilaginibacter sp. UR6-11]
MKIAGARRAIDAALDNYRNQLDTIPDELFEATPPNGGWSFAEVYSHILQATIGSTIAAERCANGTCEPTKKGLTLVGRFALLFGYMPKVKSTEEGAQIPVKKLTKEEARNLLIKCRNRVDVITPKVYNAKQFSRFKHSRFGLLNAQQWFRFILVHLNHHLKQIERIKNKFSI